MFSMDNATKLCSEAERDRAHEAEVAELKRLILARGGVRIDPEHARRVAREKLLALGVSVSEDDAELPSAS